ncbi:MAG: phosphoglycerate kinase [Elusimicrobia bacterium]|nr:phosphoglycerate kinase [Elusimicrobiota bacterium]
MEPLRLRRIQDLDLQGKRVLVRVDYNVPLHTGKVMDATRVQKTIPTLEHLLKANARIVLISHLGRPNGKSQKACSLAPVVPCLQALLNRPVHFLPDCLGEETLQRVLRLKPGEIVLLENLRFYPEEEKNAPQFAKRLSQYGEVFIQEAFGTLHRAHASTVGIPKYLGGAIGFLVQKELQFLDRTLNAPERPFLAIVGGVKVSDKIQVIRKMIERVDTLIIGGAMSYTFLESQGVSIGESPCEKDQLDLAQDIVQQTYSKGIQCLLPADHLIAESTRPDAKTKVAESMAIPPGWIGVDIGPHSIQLFSEEIAAAKTIFWNGPLGIFEIPSFAQGTLSVAKAIAEAADQGAISIVGGGDSLAAVRQAGVQERITHCSTGGGASLELLEGKALPGLAALAQVKA